MKVFSQAFIVSTAGAMFAVAGAFVGFMIDSAGSEDEMLKLQVEYARLVDQNQELSAASIQDEIVSNVMLMTRGELEKAKENNSQKLNELGQTVEMLQERFLSDGNAQEIKTTIVNPRMSGAQAKKTTASCPEGYFVSGITASSGVGGKYAVDGISALDIVCSPL